MRSPGSPLSGILPFAALARPCAADSGPTDGSRSDRAGGERTASRRDAGPAGHGSEFGSYFLSSRIADRISARRRSAVSGLGVRRRSSRNGRLRLVRIENI